ncbi:MAG TPA: hypothetical protein VF167_08510 [Longimicrobiaceae bacterium]
MLPRAALAWMLLALFGDSADAQRVPEAPAVPPPAAAMEPVAGAPAAPSAPRMMLLSAVAPGAGQYGLGQKRWIAYAAAEVVGWLWYVDRRGEGRDFEARYRDLAWDVARRVGTGERRDGDFEYYEALAKYERSGAFDADPVREGIQPESDVETYNGSVWALARAMYLPVGSGAPPEDSPEYERAVAYYRAHAASPEFAWSWVGNGGARQRYRELMRSSDEAFRAATRTLGLILANHAVSAVDALVSARLRGHRDAAPLIQFESALRVRGSETSWSAMVRIPWPRR